MPIGTVPDVLAATALSALDGITARQEVLADNLANSATPNYRARQVDFEASLAASLESTGGPAQMTVSTTDAGGPANADGNTVDVPGTTLAIQRAQVQHESMVAALNFRMSILADGLSR